MNYIIVAERNTEIYQLIQSASEGIGCQLLTMLPYAEELEETASFHKLELSGAIIELWPRHYKDALDIIEPLTHLRPQLPLLGLTTPNHRISKRARQELSRHMTLVVTGEGDRQVIVSRIREYLEQQISVPVSPREIL